MKIVCALAAKSSCRKQSGKFYGNLLRKKMCLQLLRLQLGLTKQLLNWEGGVILKEQEKHPGLLFGMGGAN